MIIQLCLALLMSVQVQDHLHRDLLANSKQWPPLGLMESNLVSTLDILPLQIHKLEDFRNKPLKACLNEMPATVKSTIVVCKDAAYGLRIGHSSNAGEDCT